MIGGGGGIFSAADDGSQMCAMLHMPLLMPLWLQGTARMYYDYRGLPLYEH